MPTNVPENLTYYVLEPIYTLMQLAMLKFSPSDTKLCIGHGYIMLRDPGYMQSVTRWAMGEHRYDIMSLHKPLMLGVDYLKNHDSKMLENIMNLVHDGLMQLSRCYTDDAGISSYILRLVKAVQSILLHKSSSISHSYFITDGHRNYPDVIDDKFIGKIWKHDELQMLVHQLEAMNKADKSVPPDLLPNVMTRHAETINLLLERKSAAFLKLLNEEHGITLS